jgi:hypothetical protein
MAVEHLVMLTLLQRQSMCQLLPRQSHKESIRQVDHRRGSYAHGAPSLLPMSPKAIGFAYSSRRKIVSKVIYWRYDSDRCEP